MLIRHTIPRTAKENLHSHSVTNVAVLHNIQNKIVLQKNENVIPVAERDIIVVCAGLCMKLKERTRILFSSAASRQMVILGWSTLTSITVM